MTRDEFESILEEAYIEGYNSLIDEIFDESDDIEDEDSYESYNEAITPENKAKIRDYIKAYKNAGGTKKGTSLATRGLVARFSSRGQDGGKWQEKHKFSDEEMAKRGYKKVGNDEFKGPNDGEGITSGRITAVHNKVARKYGEKLMDRAMKKKKDMNALMHAARKMEGKYGKDID